MLLSGAGQFGCKDNKDKSALIKWQWSWRAFWDWDTERYIKTDCKTNTYTKTYRCMTLALPTVLLLKIIRKLLGSYCFHFTIIKKNAWGRQLGEQFRCQTLKCSYFHYITCCWNLHRWGSTLSINIKSKQQPVTGATELQHSECRHTAAETISCRAAEIHWAPERTNQESFLFLSHSLQLNNALLTHKPHWRKGAVIQIVYVWARHNVRQDSRVKKGKLSQSSSSSSSILLRGFLFVWRFTQFLVYLLFLFVIQLTLTDWQFTDF